MMEPFPISQIANRYLLFDVDVVTYIRRKHNICGVFIGGIPQVPQQNVFLGLPVELLPEEVDILVQRGAAYVIDDALWHRQKLSTLSGKERQSYLASFRTQGRKAQDVAEREARKRAEHGLAKQAQLQKSKAHASVAQEDAAKLEAEVAEDSLFDFDAESMPDTDSKPILQANPTYRVTPTCSPLPHFSTDEDVMPTSSSASNAALFAYLHKRQYYLTPGLRFGCDYTVYPGDPLRFHSHFVAVNYDWDEEIPLLDIVGGGRLGTGVKKGFLIGAKDPASASSSIDDVRTFCIEWGGM